MADLRVSQLPELLENEVQASDPLLISDLSASESKKVTPVALLQATSKLIADGSIPSSKLIYPLPPDVVDEQAIANEQITDAKLVADTLTARVIAPDAIGSSELADGAVDNAAIQALAVTGGDVTGSIAQETINDYNIEPNGIGSVSLADDSVLNSHIAQGAVTGGVDGSLATATVEYLNMGVDSVGTPQLQDEAVVADVLADDAVTTRAVAPSAITPTELQANLPGTILAPDTLTAREIGPESIGASEIAEDAVDRGLDKTSGRIGHTNQIIAATVSGVDYDQFGHVTGPSEEGILPNELPIATSSEAGAVIVPSSSGLSVNASGQLAHTDAVGGATVSGISWNDTGHVIAAVPLGSNDLPVATNLEIGAVAVPGPTLQVDLNGNLTHAASGVTPGVYPKVTVDSRGHVTEGAALDAIDVPALDADKIVSGELPTARLANRSVTQQKLADYSISFIQEDIPTPDPGGPAFHNGCLHFQESTGQLNMWNGNSWMPVARGALAQQNLRWGGGIDASTGLIQYLTSFGVSSGLKVGEQLLAASDTLSGLYLVVTEPGALIDVDDVRGTDFDAADWVLCVDPVVGWQRIDTINGGGGGGGGGASFLDQLQDVTISGLVNGHLLQYNGTSGQWENRMTINWPNLVASGAGTIVTYATTNGGELIACTEIDGGDY